MKDLTRILIVEDNPNDFDLAQREIRKTMDNCEIKRVDTEEEYLAALESLQPDIILSDYGLPGFNGMKALKLAQEHAVLTPFIMWTGSLSEEVAAECMKAGANNYILKENITRLGPAILHALEERQLLLERKEAEDKLRRSESNYRALAEHSLQGIAIFQKQRIVYANPAMCTIMGYTADELLALSEDQIFAQTHPDDRAIARDRAMRRRSGETVSPFNDLRIIRKNGDIRWIQTSSNSIEYDGQPAILSTSIDITERKQAEEKLAERERRFRSLIENGMDNISLLAEDGTLLWEDPSTNFVLGYEHGRFVGESILQLLHPDDAEQINQLFAKLVHERGNLQEATFRLKHQDGTWRWIEAKATNLLDEPSVKAIVLNYRDVSEQKRAEEALREERNLLRTLIDHLPDRIYAMDKQGRKTLSNIADWRASGKKTMEDVVGKTDFDVYPAELAEPFWQVDRAVLDSGQTVINFEEPGLDFEGKPVSILTSKIPLRDEAGNVIGLVGIGRDITERRLAEQTLRENEQRYRSLFEDMPIAIWEEDFSEVKKQLDALKAQGVTDFRAYFTSHPEELARCTDPVKILNVNNKAVEMYHANNKQELIDSTLQEDGSGEKANNIEDLIAIAEGRTSHSWEGGDETSDGIPLEIRLSWSVLPGHEEDYSKVIVTTIDITEPRRVEKAEREQRALAEALRDTAQLLNSTLDYGEVLDHILAAVERVVPHNAATIMLIEGDFAHVVRSHGHAKMGVKDDVLGIQLPLATTDNLKQMLGNRQPVIVYDTSTYKGWKRLGITDWVRSNVGAPISIQGEVIGFILLDSETPGFFTPLHAERLEAFANQAALAIHNARLLHQVKDELAERKRTEIELQQKNDDLRLLNTVNNAIVRGQNLDSIVDLLTVELKRIFSAVGSTIYMLAADKRSLTMQQYSFSPEIERRIEKLIGFKIPKIQIPIKEGGHFHNALITKQSAITSDPKKIQEWIAEFTETSFLPPIARATVRKLVPHIYKLLNIKSTIIVPLISHEEVIGFLDVSGPSVFTRNDLKRIENIGEQLTSLIQRQQANEQLRKSEEFLQGVQNSLSAHVAILDGSGTIVQVNEAWRSFGEQNGLLSADYCVGMNYIATCETAAGPDADVAKEMAVAIRQILAGKRVEASFEYACHSPTEKRWFTVHITCFDDGKQKWGILAHENITTRKAAEIALGERTAQFRTLFEASPDAIVLIDPTGGWPIVDCNSAAASMNGYTREELIGKSIDILNPRAEQGTPESRSAYLESIKNTEVLRYEAIHVHKNGTPMVIEVSTTLIQLGGRDMVLGIDRDITQRKRAEDALRESEERYRSLFTNMMSGYAYCQILLDHNNKPNDFVYVHVNEAFEELTGLSDVEGRKVSEIIPGIQETNPELFEIYGRVALTGKPEKFETHIENLGIWFSISVYSPQPGYFVAVFDNISERRLAEQALKLENERFLRFAEANIVGIVIADATGRISLANDYYLNILGVSRDDFLAGTVDWKKFTPSEWLPADEKAIAELRERGICEPYEKEYERADGVRVPVYITDAMLPGPGEQIAAFILDISHRKQAEKELRDEKERAQKYLDIAGVMMLALDQDGNVSLINQRGCEILGYSSDEIIGKNWINNFIPESWRSEMQDVFQKLIHEDPEASPYSENPVLTKTGEQRLIAWHNTQIRDGNGAVITSLSSGEDITERKRAQEEIIEKQRQLTTLVSNLPGATYRCLNDSAYTMEFVSAGIQQLTGYPADDFQTQRLQYSSLIHPDDQKQVWENIQMALQEARPFELIYRIITANGSEKFVWEKGQGIQRVDAPIQSMEGLITDITELKRTEQELRDSEERFRQLATNIRDVFWITDAQTDRELYISPASESIWGCSPEYMMYTPNAFINTILPEDRPMVVASMERQRRGEKTEIEYRITHPDGSIHWVWDRAFPIFDETGRVVRLAGIAADVTERKGAELAQLLSQARYRDLFDNSPVPLWEEDYSLVKKKIESVQENGVTDLNEYLLAHPEVTLELASLVKIVDVNQASIQLYQASRKEDLLKSLTDFISAETLQQFRNEMIGLISTARFEWEGKDRTLDGRELTVMVNGSIPPGYEEDWSKVIISVNDITERKQVEERLRSSEERYHSLFKHLVDGFALHEIITDDQGKPVDYRFLEINPAFERLTGLTAENTLGRCVNEILPVVQNERFIEIYGQVALTGQPAHFEEYSPALNRYYEINAYSPHYGQFAVTFSDITERKKTEAELRKLSLAVEQSASTIVITDTTGNIEYVNPKFTEVTGYTLEEALGQNPRILKSGYNTPEDYKLLWQTITSGVEWRGELYNKKKNGDLFWEQATISPIQNEHGEITHFVAVKEDITQRKQSELEIQRHLTELEALYENGLTIGQLLEPREIGNQIIQTFARHLSWHHVAIRLLNPETDKLDLIAFNQPDLSDEARAEMETRFNRMVSTVGQGLSGWAMQTGASIRTGNVHTHPQYVDTHQGIMSGLYMPLKVADRIIGCISVESDLPDAFTLQDERLLATLANQAAIAFENARLYQAAQLEISERRRAQEALWVSETHYRQLADSITDILFELDQDLHYTHWNKASEMFSGIPAEDANGRSIREVFGSSDEQLQREEIYRAVLRERQAKIFETAVIAKGQKRYLEINAYPSAQGVAVVAKDITERRLAEMLIQKRFELIDYAAKRSLEEVLLRTIDEICDLTGSHIGFLHFVDEDQNTIILHTCSSETMRLAGMAEAWGMHQSLDSAGVWADALRERRTVIHNDYDALENKIGLPERHVQVRRELVVPILRNEKMMAVIGVGNKTQEYTSHDIELVERFADYAWDIAERKQMESALADERNQLARRVEERTADLSHANSNLARALRVKDEFLANMSHELRTPLNAILGLSESLGEQVAGPLNDKQQKYLSTINESGHHLLSLINDILDLAKIEAGQISLDINKVDVNGVCQASLRMVKQLAQRKNQEVRIEIEPNIGLMWADERRLKQMIVNLLSNAVKFTPDSSELGLEVHGDREGNRISISVWDRGIGINNNDLQRIFQPFVQLDSGLAREAAGTGLGLALVSQMAKLHGGSVTVESQVGHGSRFTIMLPWEPALSGEASSRLRTTGKFLAIKPNEVRPTVLLIEDTQEVVMMLVDYLEMSGFNMVTAQDGIDGLTQAKIAHPDLILMDIQMPRMDGIETTKKLRSDPEFKETPIIALTALAMPDDRQRCLDAGMNEYLSKPVNLRSLVKTIKAFLYESEANES